MRPHAQEYDRQTLDTLKDMLGLVEEDGNELTRQELLQCRLHVKLGGLGLASAEAVLEAAWTGSWSLCNSQVAS